MESVKQLHALESFTWRVQLSRVLYIYLRVPPRVIGYQPVSRIEIVTVGLSRRACRKVVPVLVCTSKSFHVRMWRVPFH